MPQYSYQVINKENKELSGLINAPDEKSARNELNALGFSILSLSASSTSEDRTEENQNLKKFQFSALDKSGKKIVGTIQGEEIFAVYKRLTFEYQFEVQALYPESLSDNEKEKAVIRGVDYLKDQLVEEQMLVASAQKQQEIDQVEFEKSRMRLKGQVEFVLLKVNQIIDTYKDDLDPPTKAKLKYYIEKILRIKNSTNLDYIKQTCEEMLTFLQKEEIFLNQEQRLKEKTQLSIEAKTMMISLNKVNKKGGEDIFELMRNWREEHIENNTSPDASEKLINFLLAIFIGLEKEAIDVTSARERIKNTESQIKEFLILYLQAPNPEFKKETKETLKRLWHQRKIQKNELNLIYKKRNQEKLENIEFTPIESIQREVFGLSGWVFAFYLVYYFLTIYLNTKEINWLPESKLTLIFQTGVIRYFFISLFVFICCLGLKIEFFKRRHFINPILILTFIISTSIVIFNF